FVHEHVFGLGRPGAWTLRGLGPAKLRLSSELWYWHGRDDRQGNEGIPPGHAVPERRAACKRYGAYQRRGAWAIPLGGRHCFGSAAQLRSVPIAAQLQNDGSAPEVR